MKKIVLFLLMFLLPVVSFDEDKKYNVIDHKIDQDNRSYNLVCKNIHPNFFSLISDNNFISRF